MEVASEAENKIEEKIRVGKKINWNWISENQKLSESFIEKYKNKVSWEEISARQKLSEPFIEKYKNKVNWNKISFYQELSEPFIEKYKKKVAWTKISEYQKLSDSFILENFNKLNLRTLQKNEYFKKEKHDLGIELLLKLEKGK